MTCYVNWLMKQAIRLRTARPMCDGCPFASSPSCCMAGRGLFLLCGVLFGGSCMLHFVFADANLYMYTCFFVVKSLKTKRSRPYGTATCILQTAIWLGTCQSILTQVERSSTLSAPRLAGPWDLCPSNGRRLYQEDTFSLATHHCMKMQTVIILGVLLIGPPHQRWRRDVLQPPEVPRASLPGTRVCTFRLEAYGAFRGVREGFLVRLAPLNAQGNRSIFTTRGWPGKRCQLSPRNPWERRVPASYSRATHSVPNVWYLHTKQRGCWRVGFLSIKTSCQTMRLSLTRSHVKGVTTLSP